MFYQTIEFPSTSERLPPFNQQRYLGQSYCVVNKIFPPTGTLSIDKYWYPVTTYTSTKFTQGSITVFKETHYKLTDNCPWQIKQEHAFPWNVSVDTASSTSSPLFPDSDSTFPGPDSDSLSDISIHDDISAVDSDNDSQTSANLKDYIRELVTNVGSGDDDEVTNNENEDQNN